jgi:sterol 24-C-methyltransferase
MKANEVKSTIDDYLSAYTDSNKCDERRLTQSDDLTKKFYDLVTDFYQYGWGDSFHFAPRGNDETFREAIKRHENYLALQLGLKPGVTCLDLGCGVGGPLGEIGRFSRANVTGININDYQIEKANKKMKDLGIYPQCKAIKANFCDLPFETNTIDAAYQIEATCHAPDRVACFKEVCRVLKPKTGVFAGYEWVTTARYDPNNKTHKDILYGIEKGNGLPPVISGKDVLLSLEAAGFEVLFWKDFGEEKSTYPVPWYEPLAGNFSISGLRHTRLGRTITHHLCSWAEWLHLIPKGTTEVSSLLMMTAEALVGGGREGIFSPCFFYLARKKE